MSVLSDDVINERLGNHPEWTYRDSALHRTFELADFPAAMAFMVQASRQIDALNHHPEWSNVYNKVDVHLTSHDDGGVTDKDFTLVGVFDDLAKASA